MAVIVVVGVVATNNDDSDFDRTRNAAFVKLGDIKGVVEDDGAASDFKLGDSKSETQKKDDPASFDSESDNRASDFKLEDKKR